MELKNTNHKLKGTLVRTSVDELKSRGLVQVPTALPQSKGGIVIRMKYMSDKCPDVKRTARFGMYGRIVPWLYSSFPGETKMMTRKEVKKLRKKGVRVRIIGSVVSPFACRPLAPGLESVTSSVSHSESIAVLSSPEGGGGRMSVSIGASGGGGRGTGGRRIERGKGRLASRFYGPHKSRKDELEELLLVVVEVERKLVEVKERIRSLKEEEERETEEVLDGKLPSTGLFRRYVDEASLANCFFRMYDHFYGKDRTEMLRGEFGKEIDFVALLYILMIDHKMNGDKLGVKPFHEFIMKYVLTNKQNMPCFRTMANRLKLQFLDLLEQAKSENGVQIDKKNRLSEAEENYLAVRGNFHETDYFKEIKCLLKK